METSQQNQGQSTRFNPAMDIVLLREVLATKPFEKPVKDDIWSIILQNMHTALPVLKFTKRQSRERLSQLLKKYKSNELKTLKASGTKEEYDEREILLQEIIQLMDEPNAGKNNEMKIIQDSNQRKEEVHVKIECGMEHGESFHIETQADQDERRPADPPLGKKRKATYDVLDVLDYLRERNDREMALRKEELNLKKLQLEREKERDEATIQERLQMMKLMAQMMQLAENVIIRLPKNDCT